MPKGIYKHRKGWKHSEKTKNKIAIAHIGYKFSDEAKEKMSIAKIGKTPWIKGRHFSKKSKEKMRLSHLGQKPWNIGKETSLKTRLKISKAHIGKILTEEHKLKIGDGVIKYFDRVGRNFTPYPLGWNKTFKEQIRYRDGYKCQICGMPEIENGRKLDVHHIDYNKKNIKEDNLVSLCSLCHIRTNHKREYWTKYFKGEELCVK